MCEKQKKNIVKTLNFLILDAIHPNMQFKMYLRSCEEIGLQI